MICLEINQIQYLEIKGKLKLPKILIFLPGLGAYKENYIKYANRVSSNYSNVYILDLPQQGSKGNWTIGNMVDNLKEFINHIDNNKISQIHLAGHSAGALAILSFVVNLNLEVEKLLLKNNVTVNSFNLKSLEDKGFGVRIDEAKKVSKLFLYSPCDAFENVFPKSLVKLLEKSNHANIRVILNIFINIPMLFFNLFSKNNYLNFNLNKHRKPQYFGLILNNYKSFFSYLCNCKCLFEVFRMLDKKQQQKVFRIFENKSVIMHFGNIDWLLMSKNRCKTKMVSNLKLFKNFQIIEHKRLGHFLNKKISLDINLNNQMLINRDVLKQSIQYMKAS